ncbi:hypothetical protein PPE03_22080 [Pseudoalteromonas peptidolytica]|nr:hypothetical protein PPE03_22080 [Pseudoalteromonas peptidolytica]
MLPHAESSRIRKSALETTPAAKYASAPIDKLAWVTRDDKVSTHFEAENNTKPKTSQINE